MMDIIYNMVIELKTAAQVIGCSGVAALTWILTDYVVTFTDEVNFIWLKPWGPVKVLFIWTRYFGIALIVSGVIVSHTGPHSILFCRKYFYWEGNAGVVIFFVVEILLQARIYAVYNKNKALALFNFVFYLAEIIVILVILNVGFGSSISLGTPQIPGLKGLKGCYGHVPSYFYSLWVPGLVYDFWLTSLAVHKGIERAKRGIRVERLQTNLLSLLIRDSAVYYVMIAIAILSNVIVWLVLPPYVMEAAVPLAIACVTNGGTRLLLNLRRAAAHDEEKTTTLSDAEFASHQDVWSRERTLIIDPLLHDEEASDAYIMEDVPPSQGLQLLNK